MLEIGRKWQNSVEYNKAIHEEFCRKVNEVPELKELRDFVESYVYGFGERSFYWMWKLIVDDLPDNFRFLEIGVFKGQVLALIRKLAIMSNLKAEIYGVTPLDTSGGMWEGDYSEYIQKIHDLYALPYPDLFVGMSTDKEILAQASQIMYDVVYIDGGHDEATVEFDITNYSKLVRVGGYLVIDDCCNAFAMPFGYFTGIGEVSKVVDRMLPPLGQNDDFKFLFNVVHNRVYKRVK
jgi:SAM-dependent methyltransferase